MARSLRLLRGTSSASDQVPLLLRAMSTADAPVLAAAAASEAEGVCLSGSEGVRKTTLEIMALESALNKAKARLAVYRAKERQEEKQRLEQVLGIKPDASPEGGDVCAPEGGSGVVGADAGDAAVAPSYGGAWELGKL